MDEKILREHLRLLLDWHEAHVDWKAAFKDFPANTREAAAGLRIPPGNCSSTCASRQDILEFCRNPKHVRRIGLPAIGRRTGAPTPLRGTRA